jgi:streptogramin lyase
MSGTAGTLDADLKGNIWVTSPDGALRFNIEKETFTEFKSVSYKMPDGGPATVYGLASDRDGNGWWLLMSYDLVNYSDIKTGKSAEFKLEPEKAVMDRLTPEQRKLYETFSPNFNSPYPWAHAPRRMGADKNGDYVWVGNSFGGNFAKVNIKTKEVTFVPLPNPEAQQPYQISVDKNHNVWTNLWSTDQIAKFDPSTSNWTIFNLPTRGTESRHISLLENERGLQVSVPYDRTRKVAVMTIRSDADVQALKSQAEAQR